MTVFVTAFLDIGRNDWKEFQRTTNTYVESFLRLYNQIRQLRTTETLVVFLDEKLIQSVSASLVDRASLADRASWITIVPINEKFMMENSPLWKRLPREIEIMNSTEYKNLMKDRLQFPEHNNPRYTLINHAKIDFVAIAMEMLPLDEHFCWVDFGYCSSERLIPNKITMEKYDKNTVCYTLINQLDNNDRYIMYTLQMAPEKFGGFFFHGNRDTLTRYRKLYHEIHNDFQLNNIADDDQHIAMRCYFAQPELFSLYHLGAWHAAFTY